MQTTFFFSKSSSKQKLKQNNSRDSRKGTGKSFIPENFFDNTRSATTFKIIFYYNVLLQLFQTKMTESLQKA